MDQGDPETFPGGPPPFVSGMGNHDLGDRHNDIFFAAVSTTRMPMIVTDPNRDDNPIVFANPAFIQMTGYAREELLGRNCRLLQGPETDRETLDEVRESIAQRREVSVEILNYKKNGASFWNALFISPVYDANGKLLYFFASQLDVSRRRDAEDALRQSQKMEAIGQLTGGVAHDFNNLLTVIQGFSDILQNQLRDPDTLNIDKARRSVAAVLQAAERGAALTQQLLAFSRKQKLQGRVVDVNEMVANLLPIIERTAGGTIQIEPRLADGACTARIDPTQAELAVINILINARDAMPDGGRIVIAVEEHRTEAEGAPGDLAPGRYISLCITDDGAGMAPEVLARVTEPFFTTKEQGKGTGLGLSMVYGFMKQSGGAIRIESAPGEGTTVRLYFPAEAASAPEDRKAPQATREGHGRETVLVVEDQEDVGDYAEAVLTEFGYRVLRAADGHAALEILDGHEEIGLLFSDLIMPGGMNGVVLAREAKRRRPRLRVLLTTGYAESAIERVDARGTEFELIDKPYKRIDLAARVRRAIDGPNGVA